MLVSDVDDTLLGDAEALESFRTHLAARSDLLLVLNSSRPVASVRRSLGALSGAPAVSGVIGAMGTEIVLGDEWDHEWCAAFGTWDRQPIDALMASLGARLHDDEFQTPFKASYAVPPEMQDAARDALHHHPQSVTIVRSGLSDFDVLPPQAGKGPAIARVRQRLAIPWDRLIVAGDSANDLTMFETAEMGIVVGNAREELVSQVDPDRAYLARRPCAGGILEGLDYWTNLSRG